MIESCANDAGDALDDTTAISDTGTCDTHVPLFYEI